MSREDTILVCGMFIVLGLMTISFQAGRESGKHSVRPASDTNWIASGSSNTFIDGNVERSNEMRAAGWMKDLRNEWRSWLPMPGSNVFTTYPNPKYPDGQREVTVLSLGHEQIAKWGVVFKEADGTINDAPIKWFSPLDPQAWTFPKIPKITITNSEVTVQQDP